MHSTPTTLIALLRAVAYGWRQTAPEDVEIEAIEPIERTARVLQATEIAVVPDQEQA